MFVEQTTKNIKAPISFFEKLQHRNGQRDLGSPTEAQARLETAVG